MSTYLEREINFYTVQLEVFADRATCTVSKGDYNATLEHLRNFGVLHYGGPEWRKQYMHVPEEVTVRPTVVARIIEWAEANGYPTRNRQE